MDCIVCEHTNGAVLIVERPIFWTQKERSRPKYEVVRSEKR